MPDFVARTDLDAKVGALVVTRMIDDSGTGVVDTGPGSEEEFLNTIIEEAEGIAIGYMMSAGYDAASVKVLADNDKAFKGNVSWMALEMLSERRLEFTAEDGWGAYRVQYERAESYLKALSKGRRRTQGEAAAGRNRQIGGKVQPAPPSGTSQQFQFAPNKHAPSGRGGF